MKPALTSLLAGLVICAGFASAQCPAVGNDTGCGTVITITDTGVTVAPTGQGPYDGVDDTLVGVVNNSSAAISSLGLTSSLPIFAFDGDGIDSFGIAGNTLDTTGYGGPNAYFTNINSDLTTGTVNFILAITAHGGTGYFSLENALSTATTQCSSILNNAFFGPFLGGSGLLHGPTQITANFNPGTLGFTLGQAAQICGFVNFDWMQQVKQLPDPSPFCVVNHNNPTAPDPSPFCGANLAKPFPIHLTSAAAPFSDPAPGAYTYNPVWNSAPFYWQVNSSGLPWSLDQHETLNGAPQPVTIADTLDAFDAPTDFCISGPLGLPSFSYLTSAAVRALCDHSTTPRNSFIGFTTHLAGVNADGTGVDLGIGYDWTSNFNGTFGGISTTASYAPVDPESGVGGITITNVNKTTTFQGVTVTNVNGNAPGIPPVLASGTACNGVFGGTFKGDMIVSSGQSCTFMHGTITGHIHQFGGNLVLTGVQVGGSIRIHNESIFSLGPGVVIADDLEIDGDHDRHGDRDQDRDRDRDVKDGVASSAQNQICGVTVNHDLQVRESRIPIQIGSDSPTTCGGNLVGGDLDVEENKAPTMIFDNAIGGDLRDQNNDARSEVFNNNVSNQLVCEDNNSIIGAGNEAKHKRGQCSRF